MSKEFFLQFPVCWSIMRIEFLLTHMSQTLIVLYNGVRVLDKVCLSIQIVVGWQAVKPL